MKFRFPFQFKGFLPKEFIAGGVFNRKIRLIPLRRVNTYLGEGSIQAFGKIYTNVLQAMADFDYEYLSHIMEPRLFKASESCLKELQEKNYSLEYIEQKESDFEETTEEGDPFKDERANMVTGPLGFVYEEKDLQMHVESRGIFGAHIDRSKNIGPAKQYGGDYTSMTFYLTPQKTWKQVYKTQILVLNIYYYTSRKLYLKDEEGDILEGSDNIKERFDHQLRFETYTDEIDWVLCDIDNFMKGNPYFAPAEDQEPK